MEKLLKPPAEAVALLSDLTDMDRSALRLAPEHQAGIPVNLPEDAYFEYVWRDAAGKLLTDPDNPDSNSSVWFGRVSVVRGPDYAAHPVADESQARPQGTLRRERFQSDALQQLRRVNSYSPAGSEAAELPTVLVQDGTAFNRLGLLPQALDIMVARGLPPARLVLLEPVDRSREYSFSASYRDFILDELVPALPELAGEVSELHLLGASLGGLASVTLALQAPQEFRGVASLSGAFLGGPDDPDPYGSKQEWVRQQVEAGAELPARWFIGTGTIEWLHGANKRFADALVRRDLKVDYLERSAGHNWQNWRDMIPAALTRLLAD